MSMNTFIYIYICIYIYIYISKVGDHSRGGPEGSLFDSYYTNPRIAPLYP